MPSSDTEHAPSCAELAEQLECLPEWSFLALVGEHAGAGAAEGELIEIDELGTLQLASGPFDLATGQRVDADGCTAACGPCGLGESHCQAVDGGCSVCVAWDTEDVMDQCTAFLEACAEAASEGQ